MGIQTAQWRNVNFLVEPQEKKSYFEVLTKHLDTSSGIYRFCKALQQVSELFAMTLSCTGSFLAQNCEHASKIFAAGSRVLVYPRLPSLFESGCDAVVDLSLNRGSVKNLVDNLHDISETVSMTAYAALGLELVGKALQKGVEKMASHLCVFADGLEATSLAILLNRVSLMQNEVAKDDDFSGKDILLKRCEITSREARLKFVKVIASVVAGALAFTAALFGGLVSPICLLSLGLISTIAAIGAHFYKETADYPPIKYREIERIELGEGSADAFKLA